MSDGRTAGERSRDGVIAVMSSMAEIAVHHLRAAEKRAKNRDEYLAAEEFRTIGDTIKREIVGFAKRQKYSGRS